MPPLFYFRPFDFHADTREPDKRLRFMFIPLPLEVEDPDTARLLQAFIVIVNLALLLTIAAVALAFLSGVIVLPGS